MTQRAQDQKQPISSSEERIRLAIEGMTCVNCSARIERILKKEDGVEHVEVNFANERALIQYDSAKIDIEQLIGRIERAGFRAVVDDEAHEEERILREKARRVRLSFTLIVSALLSAPMLLAMMGKMVGAKGEWVTFFHTPWVQLLLATPVQFWAGARFYRGAYSSLKGGVPNMDLLVALGTTSAYLYSFYNGFLGGDPHHLYFESSAVIITLVLLGNYFEVRAKDRTHSAIKSLLTLQPKKALRIIGENRHQTEEIDIDQVAIGDRLLIHPGSNIPVDGRVVHGHSALDESMLTGESLPVEKAPNSKVYSGTINQTGVLVIEAERSDQNSTLARIIRLVRSAQGSRAPIQQVADRVSAYFVPFVVAIALITLLIVGLSSGAWGRAIMQSVAVLVIACPCALGLATPTAIMVGSGLGAREGILIRNGEALERTAKVNTIILDKTGTITEGKPEVTDFIPLKEGNRGRYIEYMTALESNSEHPLGRALFRYGLDRLATDEMELPRVESFRAEVGSGVEGVIEGRNYYIGSPRLMADRGLSTGFFQEKIAELEAEAKSVMLLANEFEVLALIAVADRVKESSKRALQALQKEGVSLYMMTGDNRLTAEKIGQEVGIPRAHIIAEMRPEDKADYVAKLQAEGGVVAMVGDGMNDAPALARADIGIAMGTGTDIAMESSDVTIMNGDLSNLLGMLILSRATMRKIKQNLFWAFFYNALGIPFAAFGLLNPMIAGGAMAFSSVSVVLNSLSLGRTSLKRDE